MDYLPFNSRSVCNGENQIATAVTILYIARAGKLSKIYSCVPKMLSLLRMYILLKFPATTLSRVVEARYMHMLSRMGRREVSNFGYHASGLDVGDCFSQLLDLYFYVLYLRV